MITVLSKGGVWYDIGMIRGTKRKIRRFGMFLSVGVLLTFACFLTYKIYTVSLERYQINKQISTVAEELKSLDAQNKDLTALVARLKDKSYLEKEARKKLNVQLPGEQSVIITGQSTIKSSTTQKETSSKPTALSNTKQWMGTLFGN